MEDHLFRGGTELLEAPSQCNNAKGGTHRTHPIDAQLSNLFKPGTDVAASSLFVSRLHWFSSTRLFSVSASASDSGFIASAF